MTRGLAFAARLTSIAARRSLAELEAMRHPDYWSYD
jgi:hypothetical protein